jgi:transposase-like protein
VYLGDQKLPIEVPRVRDQHRHVEVPLPTYERLQQPRTGDTGLLHKGLGGLSTREYERCAEAVLEAFGLSASTVSRRFKRASARKLRALMERRLDGYDLVALLLDGKTFAEDEMVTAVGVTITGEKILLGFVQTATENRKVCAAFLRELVERGLQIEAGLLVVTDGAKGLHAAVREVCGSAALLQRGQWHKRENVLKYLPDRHRAAFRRKLQAASERPTYEAATRALTKLRGELTLLHASAAASLDEGFEETLTLHRLGVFAELGTSLKRTNTLESIHARVESRTAKVDHWKNSEQKQRWLATALLDLEPRLRGREEVGGVNSGSLTEFQLRMVLTHAVKLHEYHAVRRFLRRRHEIAGFGYRQFPMHAVFGTLGVLSPESCPPRSSGRAHALT